MKKLAAFVLAVGLAVPALVHAADHDAVIDTVLTNSAITLTARVDSMTTAHRLSGWNHAAFLINVQLDSLTTSARFAVMVKGSQSAAVDTVSSGPSYRLTPLTVAEIDSFVVTATGDSITPASGEHVFTAVQAPYAANKGLTPTDQRNFTIPIRGYFGNQNPIDTPHVWCRIRLLKLYGTGLRAKVVIRFVGSN
jgi:hypothetical protein